MIFYRDFTNLKERLEFRLNQKRARRGGSEQESSRSGKAMRWGLYYDSRIVLAMMIFCAKYHTQTSTFQIT
jgi:hypothetical protein